jgi:hypothetical protein
MVTLLVTTFALLLLFPLVPRISSATATESRVSSAHFLLDHIPILSDLFVPLLCAHPLPLPPVLNRRLLGAGR